MANQNSQPTEETKLDPQEVDGVEIVDPGDDGTFGEGPPEAKSKKKDDDKGPDERQHFNAPDNKRSEIGKNFRRTDSKPFEDVNADETSYGTNASRPGEDDDDEGAVLEGAPTEEQPDPNAGKKRYVVDGQEKWLTEDEVTRIVQKNLNADKVTHEVRQKETELERALQRISELEQRFNQSSDSSEQPDRQQSPTSPQQQAQPDQAAGLAEIAEALQVGDTEEAAKALQRLLAMRDQGQTPDPTAIIRTVREDEDQKAARRAFQEFATATPEFNPDDWMQSRKFQTALDVERINDIATAAEQFGKDPNEVRKNLANQPPEEVARIHREMMVSGSGPRSYGDLFKAAYTHLAPGGKPQSGVNISEERQRRAQAAQPQPAARGRPTQTQVEKPKTGSDIVASMRKARGQVA